uniref:Phage major capsid protein n=1 Tax=Schlesneria paludicola TaxID=360056 RepID=A0A7C2K114_9PLAN
MQGANLKTLIESLGAEGFYHKLCTLLNEQQLSVDDFSYRELAEACDVLPQLRRMRDWSPDGRPVTALLRESNPGVNTSLFQVVTGELVGRKVIEGYEDRTGFIGDKLVTVMPSRVRNARIAGFRALSGPAEVAEGHPYEESTFEEKHVTSAESKQGRILSINEELLAFDQTGEINRRAMALGFYLRQERERTIIRAVTDADAGNGQFVYRPNGTGQTLYAADGSNRNWVGAGNTTSPAFSSAVPLVDWTDIDYVLNYRATEVKDDRIDGEARPIVCPVKQLLVPERLRGTARSLIHSTEIAVTSDDQETRFANPVHGLVEVLSSPFIDEQGGQAVNDWYLGDFKKQFLWTEIWPVQTFLQRADGEAAFDRDVVLRVKVRYYGGVSAVDTVFVTKVDGA